MFLCLSYFTQKLSNNNTGMSFSLRDKTNLPRNTCYACVQTNLAQLHAAYLCVSFPLETVALASAPAFRRHSENMVDFVIKMFCRTQKLWVCVCVVCVVSYVVTICTGYVVTHVF